GLVFIFIVPPWQHYDEPGHFEFAWLIANQEGIPSPGTYDQNMRRELAASMIEHGFFDSMNFQPNLLAQDEPIWIGFSQISDQPLYYYFAGIPLRFIPYTDIVFQLYLMRIVSLGLYLTTILAAYGIIRELIPYRHPVHWMLPLSIALLPGFADLMTAVNSDVGATAFFSLFLWMSVCLIQRGFSWPKFLIMAIMAVITFYTKNTVSLVSILWLPVLLFALLRDSRRRYAWMVVALMGLVALVVVFHWGDAANWYRQTYSNKPTRIVQNQSPFGNYAFDLTLDPNKSPPRLLQVLPRGTVNALQGKTISLGAWIWASEPVTIRLPVLMDDFGARSKIEEVSIGTDPKFFASTATFPDHTVRVWISLEPFSNKVEAPINVYYDGVIVTSGLYPLDEVPNYLNGRTNSGVW
ncbi:MAG: hypothetical protein ACNA8H_13720, partial [Anaerolineales bacterium]